MVYPWHCLRSGCDCVYSYEDQDTMYFGCLHKVFASELDLAAFCEHARESVPKPKTGNADNDRRCGRVKAADPYGAIRVTRTPRPQCVVRVEQAYDAVSTSSCCNPTFFHHPSAPAEDTMRLTAKPSDEGASRSEGDSGARN